MRAHFSTGWIFQGWIACLIFASCIQFDTGDTSCLYQMKYNPSALHKPVCLPTSKDNNCGSRRHAKPTCNEHQYLRGNKCCNKCAPGTYLFAHCTEDSPTTCRQCGTNEYQSEFNTEEKCHKQEYCDEGRGFIRPSPSSTIKSEPCRCKEGFQCATSYCEYCDIIPQCPAGQGLAGDLGNQSCKECKEGFFSNTNSAEPCKKWTDCKAIGKTQEKPGSAKADVVCGPPFEPSTSWAVVAVLCAIIVIFAVILSCYKDKLNLLSVNLRTCVQNIKRSRIQQETLTPPYHSNSLQGRAQYVITSHLLPQDDSSPEYLSMCSEIKTDCDASQDKTQEKITNRLPTKPDRERADGSSGSSTEGSEGPSSPLSCSCLFIKEPMEVGENEDCSELVATSLATCCTCSQGENLEETIETKPSQDGSVSLKESPPCRNCYAESVPEHLQGSQELYLDFSTTATVSKEDMSEIRDLHSDPNTYERKEPRCCSIESTVVPSSPDIINKQLSLITTDDNNLSLPDAAALEIQNQTSEAALTCAQVTGNNNTTFISTGQVMNFTGDVIMVYVSQTSLGSSGGEEEPYASPVQEESAEYGIQNTAKHATVHERQLPVQEMTNQRPQLNISV